MKELLTDWLTYAALASSHIFSRYRILSNSLRIQGSLQAALHCFNSRQKNRGNHESKNTKKTGL